MGNQWGVSHSRSHSLIFFIFYFFGVWGGPAGAVGGGTAEGADLHTSRSPNINSQQRSDEIRGKEQRGSLNAKPYCRAVGVCVNGICCCCCHRGLFLGWFERSEKWANGRGRRGWGGGGGGGIWWWVSRNILLRGVHVSHSENVRFVLRRHIRNICTIRVC